MRGRRRPGRRAAASPPGRGGRGGAPPRGGHQEGDQGAREEHRRQRPPAQRHTQPLVVQLVQWALGHGAHPGTLPGNRSSKVRAMTAGGSDGTVDILVTRIDADVPLPSYAHPGDAGADLVTTVDVRLEPGQRTLVPTGIAIALPAGYV